MISLIRRQYSDYTQPVLHVRSFNDLFMWHLKYSPGLDTDRGSGERGRWGVVAYACVR